MQAFFDSYTKYILPEDILLLAVSGGVDSMVLLDLVLANHPRENIVVAHFDHSLRGVESDEDRLFIAKLCNKRNVHFEVEKMDISTLAQEEKMSIEMAARKYRYMFLHEIAEKYQAKYILTAHHLDDRIETAMFNLIRGSKLGGIHALGEVSGTETLDSKSTEYLNQRVVSDFSDPITNHQSPTTILRPLLHIPKSDIFDYARAHHIEYREDSTNTDTTYLRNYLRHMVLPEFERINPEYRRSIENFIEYSGEVQNWIDMQVRQWIENLKSKIQNSQKVQKNAAEYIFLISDFQSVSPFFQREVVRYLYEVANSGTIGLSAGLIDELIRFITEGSNSYGIREVKKLRLERRGERITVS